MLVSKLPWSTRIVRRTVMLRRTIDATTVRHFYEGLAGSEQLRVNFMYKRNCKDNRTKPVQCAVCMKDHHTLCFKRADQWNNDQDMAQMRKLHKGQTLCWECYDDDAFEPSEESE